MMRVRPYDEDTYKALRMVARSEAWQYLKPWLEENLEQTRRELYDETEPMAMNRLVGEAKTLSGLLDEIENAPLNEASFANGTPRKDIDPMM